MSTRHNATRDPFRFSLRGLATTAFGGTPYGVGDTGINRAWDEKLGNTAAERPVSAAGETESPTALQGTAFGLRG